MKNFLDLTAIDIRDQLIVDISLKEHNQALYKFTINDVEVRGNIVKSFGLLDNLKFLCMVDVGAVEIENISINGFQVLPIYQHLANPKTNWVTSNWEFSILEPFYMWKHKITGQGWIF